eukprot:scaffold140335_cov30-Tisochrysis_lutea.AAC.1
MNGLRHRRSSVGHTGMERSPPRISGQPDCQAERGFTRSRPFTLASSQSRSLCSSVLLGSPIS